MTTIVVVRKGDYACIAADTLTKYGDIMESAKYAVNFDKIDAVGDSFLSITGDASFSLIARNYFSRPRVAASFHNCDQIFQTMLRMHKALKDTYFLNSVPKEDEPFECSQMEALVANAYGIFGIYALRSVMEYTRFYALGTGSNLALGAMYACYDSIDDPQEIARIAIEAAAEFDDDTALPMTFRKIRLRKSKPSRATTRR